MSVNNGDGVLTRGATMKQLILKIAGFILFMIALPIQAQNYTKVTYIHSDADGTAFAATDSQGVIEWQIDHYPYGDEYSNTQVARKSEISFAGKPFDEEIGLSYFGARWYDPDIGRFTGIDAAPVDPNDYRTFNRYSYGFNNPYKYVDPDGNFPIDYAIDGISISISAGLFANDPSIGNAVGLIGDIVLGVIPYVPSGIGIIRAGDKAVDGARTGDVVTSTNQGRNKLQPHPDAEGPHTVWKNDHQTGDITRHETYTPNSRNPSGFDKVQNTDLNGAPHYNKKTGETVPTPHTQGQNIPGGVRPATSNEVPKPK